MVENNKSIQKKEIIKSNNLIESSYKLTISENRLIDLALTKLETIMLDNTLSAEEVKILINKKSFDEIEINVMDYKKEYGIKNNTIYEELEKSASRLYERDIKYKEGKTSIRKRWVITCKYNEDRCSISIQFHPDLIPDLIIFKGCYTRFDFDIKKYIKSFYTCKIYELLKQYESFGQRIFDIEQLRFLLGIEDNEYPEYSNLKQRIISPAIKQINEITDLYCEFEEIKCKRKVEKIKIRFVCQKINFQLKEQLSIFDKEIAIDEDTNSHNIVKDFRKVLGLTVSPKQIEKIVSLASKSIKKYNLHISIKDYISQKKAIVDEYAKTTEVRSYLGVIIRAIENNWTLIAPESKQPNFKQRDYDFKELEKQLLGWDD